MAPIDIQNKGLQEDSSNALSQRKETMSNGILDTFGRKHCPERFPKEIGPALSPLNKCFVGLNLEFHKSTVEHGFECYVSR